MRLWRKAPGSGAQAGALLSQIGNRALELGLTGMEFAAGIPGTAGGAVVMNAGAYGGEMKDILAEVTVLNRDGEILTIPADRLELGYRTSIIKKNSILFWKQCLNWKTVIHHRSVSGWMS